MIGAHIEIRPFDRDLFKARSRKRERRIQEHEDRWLITKWDVMREGEDAQPQAARELKTAQWCWSCACTVPAQPVPNLGAAGAVLGLFRGANPQGEKKNNLKLRGILQHGHVWYQYGSFKNC